MYGPWREKMYHKSSQSCGISGNNTVRGLARHWPTESHSARPLLANCILSRNNCDAQIYLYHSSKPSALTHCRQTVLYVFVWLTTCLWFLGRGGNLACTMGLADNSVNTTCELGRHQGRWAWQCMCGFSRTPTQICCRNALDRRLYSDLYAVVHLRVWKMSASLTTEVVIIMRQLK